MHDRHDEDEEVDGPGLLLAGGKEKNFGKYTGSMRDGGFTAFLVALIGDTPSRGTIVR